MGPPIHGALLTGDFIWWRPAVFSGVRRTVSSDLGSISGDHGILRQIFSLAGALGFATLPILIRRRKLMQGV